MGESSRRRAQQDDDNVDQDTSNQTEARAEAKNALMAQPHLTRRAFVGNAAVLAAGALAYVGCCSIGGASVYAYADEEGSYSFVIVVLGREEIAALAVDASSKRPVKDMSVTVTSLCARAPEKKLGPLSTDEHGLVVANVRRLSEQHDQDEPIAGYSFWGSVEASCKGFRDFASTRMRILAGPSAPSKDKSRKPNLELPTQPFDLGRDKAYLRLCSFDGYDMQYAFVTFSAASGNDADHEVSLQVVAQDGSQVNAWFEFGGNRRGGEASARVSGGRANLSIKGIRMKDLPVGQTGRVLFKVGATTYEMPARLKIIEAAASLAEPRLFSSMKFSPGGSVQAGAGDDGVDYGGCASAGSPDEPGLSFTLPDWVPIGGGGKIDLDLPAGSVTAAFDPDGYVGIAVSMTEIAPYSTTGGEYDPKQWKFFSKETMDDWSKRREQDYDRLMKSYRDAKAIKEGRGKPGMQRKFGGLDLKFNFSMMALGYWGTEGARMWSLGASAVMDLLVKYTWGQQALVGPVPVYVGFDLGINATVTAHVGFSMKGLDFSTITWQQSGTDTERSGLTIAQRFEIGVFAGLGVRGLLSLGVRGYGYFGSTIGLIESGRKPFPHIVLGAGAGVNLEVSGLWFVYTKQLYGKDVPDLVDNWKAQEEWGSAEEAVLPPPEYVYSEEGLADFVPILDEDLIQAAEFEAQVNAEGDLVNFTHLVDTMTGADCSGVGILPSTNYDIECGVKPSVETRIFKDVVFDSRSKIVETNGTYYLCRLSVVKVTSATEGSGVLYDAETGQFTFGASVPGEVPASESASASESEGIPASEGGIAATSADSPAVGTDEAQASAAAASAPEWFKSARPRVTVSKFDGTSWGAPTVVDFKFPTNEYNYKRANYYDNDFDVAGYDGKLYFNIACGQRGTFWNFERAFKSQIYVCAVFDPAANKVVQHVTADLERHHLHHSYYFGVKVLPPRFKSNPHVGFSYARRDGDDDKESTRYILDWFLYGDLTREDGTCEFKFQNADNPSIYDTVDAGPGPIVEDHETALFTYRAGKNTWATQFCKRGQVVGGIKNLADTTEPVIADSKGFLVTSTEDDKKTTPDIRTGKPRPLVMHAVDARGNRVEPKEIGIAGSTCFTSSPHGSHLFTYRVMEKHNPKDDAAAIDGRDAGAEGTDFEAQAAPLYQIYAANWLEGAGRYSDFYPFAQMAHPMDNVTCSSMSTSVTTFVYTTITDAKKVQGDVYVAKVPFVCAIQLDGASSPDVFCGVGDTCHVTVTVANAGNLPLSAFGAVLYDNKEGSGDPIAKYTYDKLGESVLPSLDALIVDEETGEYVYEADPVDAAGVLWPGRTRSYKGLEFKVPPGWKGVKELYVFVRDPKVARVEEGYLYGAEIDEAVDPFYDVDTFPSKFELDDVGDYPLAPESLRGDYKVSGGGGGKKKPLAPTGDGAGPLAGAVGALGAGAAAFAAYSARRTRLEAAAGERDDREER